jgi:hypothetical protein
MEPRCGELRFWGRLGAITALVVGVIASMTMRFAAR